MWLYIPRGYCLSSQESVDSIARYGLFFQNVELFVTSSGKPTPRPYSWRGWKTRPWMKLLYGVTLQPSTVSASMDAWIQSLSASHVKTSQSQASKKELSKAHDQDSSMKPAELFAKYSQGIFLSKTSQDSLLTDSCQSYSESFPKWGSMRSGECFRQEMWEAPILEKESSSWPTATRQDFKRRGPNSKQQGLPEEVNNWRTPSASDPVGGVKDLNSEKYKNAEAPKIKLRNQSASWPTPAMRDYKGTYNTIVRKDGKCRLDQLANASIYTGPLAQAKQKNGNESSKNDPTLPLPLTSWPTPNTRDTRRGCNQKQLAQIAPPKKRLNPNFVEWLMGVPVGWSLPTPIDQNAYKRWETESLSLLEQLH